MTKKPKLMKMNRETLRNLSDDEAGHAAGGSLSAVLATRPTLCKACPVIDPIKTTSLPTSSVPISF